MTLVPGSPVSEVVGIDLSAALLTARQRYRRTFLPG
jgi:hypothetical protein